MHRGVGAPRSPRRGSLLECGRQRLTRRSPQPQVSGGERIHFAERAHGQVVRRPGTDAGERAEPIDEGPPATPAAGGGPAPSARRHRMLSARARVSPISSSGADGSRSGGGNRRVSPSAGAGLGAPNASTSRPANVVAARTLTCLARPVHGTAAGWSATLDPAKRGESSERNAPYRSYGLDEFRELLHRGAAAELSRRLRPKVRVVPQSASPPPSRPERRLRWFEVVVTSCSGVWRPVDTVRALRRVSGPKRTGSSAVTAHVSSQSDRARFSIHFLTVGGGAPRFSKNGS